MQPPRAGAKLHVTHWLPEGRPKAVILLAHGYAEHAGRYEYVAKRLTGAGYAIYAVDHWGHGQSDGEGGFVPRFSAFARGAAVVVLSDALECGGHAEMELAMKVQGADARRAQMQMRRAAAI